jgi:HAD superfamily hydrolase (TIGR01509 family)
MRWLKSNVDKDHGLFCNSLSGCIEHMTKQIDAILFDMGGTLRNSVKASQAERDEAIQRIIDLLGIKTSVGVFGKKLRENAEAYKGWAESTLKELSEEELWVKWMLPDFPEEQIRPIAIQLNQLYRDSLSTRIVFPTTYEVVVKLFRRGYRLGLVSNTTSSVEVPALLKELHIAGCFETVILSTVIGKRKPDPEILLDAARRMGVDPKKCAYIGDQPGRDVAAAREAGFSQTVIIRHGDNKIEIGAGDPDLIPNHRIHDLRDLLDIFPVREPAQPKQVYDVSLSTMWLKDNFPTLLDFFEFARRSGYARVELNHKINSEILQGIDFDRNSVGSLHEPCPADIPMDTLVKRDWVISSINEENRQKGVEAVKRSIELAACKGQSTIVIHPGHVVMDVTLEKQLRRLIQDGREGSAEFQTLKQEMIRIRAELIPLAFEAVKKSVSELVEYARPRKVRLGLENRFHYREIPSLDEMETLLTLGGPEILGMTFDVGHAKHLSRLGFYPYKQWLERFSTRIFETHLHDFQEITDHFAAGLGEVDFDEIATYLPENAIRTCEYLDTNSAEQVKSALRYLSENGCIRKL